MDSTGIEYLIYNGDVYDPDAGVLLGSMTYSDIYQVLKRPDGADRLISWNNDGQVRVYRSLLYTTDSPSGDSPALPATLSLSAYPNPFNPVTTIHYEMPDAAHTILDVFNVAGRRIMHSDFGRMNAGAHDYSFDAAALPSGIYFARLSTPTMTRSIKLLLTK